jgi:protein-S-isoprenylcysteine O-methyltransferase Ste14
MSDMTYRKPTTGIDRTFKSRGPLAGIVILPAVAYACLSPPLVNAGTWADAGLSVLAWAIFSAGIVMRIWATLYIGGRKSVALVTEGPYAACRHPLYVGSFFVAVSLAVFLKSPVVLVAVAATAFIYAVWIIPSEEQHALACFGAAYREYQAATPRFIPSFRRLKRPGFVEIKVAELLRELGRDLIGVMIGASAELVAHCRAEPWWPHLVRFL